MVNTSLNNLMSVTRDIHSSSIVLILWLLTATVALMMMIVMIMKQVIFFWTWFLLVIVLRVWHSSTYMRFTTTIWGIVDDFTNVKAEVYKSKCLKPYTWPMVEPAFELGWDFHWSLWSCLLWYSEAVVRQEKGEGGDIIWRNKSHTSLSK